MYLVDKLHEAGIGVILDWVPAHFPRDAHGLRRFDGTALFEHENPMQGENARSGERCCLTMAVRRYRVFLYQAQCSLWTSII